MPKNQRSDVIPHWNNQNTLRLWPIQSVKWYDWLYWTNGESLYTPLYTYPFTSYSKSSPLPLFINPLTPLTSTDTLTNLSPHSGPQPKSSHTQKGTSHHDSWYQALLRSGHSTHRVVYGYARLWAARANERASERAGRVGLSGREDLSRNPTVLSIHSSIHPSSQAIHPSIHLSIERAPLSGERVYPRRWRWRRRVESGTIYYRLSVESKDSKTLWVISVGRRPALPATIIFIIFIFYYSIYLIVYFLF